MPATKPGTRARPPSSRLAQLTSANHHTGVKSYEVSLENQTATVVAGPDLPFETVLQKIAKTGKKVNSGEVDGVSHSIELPAAA